VLRCGHITGEDPSRLGLRSEQQIECDEVRDHQHRHVDDRDRVGGAQLPRQRRKGDPGSAVHLRLARSSRVL